MTERGGRKEADESPLTVTLCFEAILPMMVMCFVFYKAGSEGLCSTWGPFTQMHRPGWALGLCSSEKTRAAHSHSLSEQAHTMGYDIWTANSSLFPSSWKLRVDGILKCQGTRSKPSRTTWVTEIVFYFMQRQKNTQNTHGKAFKWTWQRRL